MKLVSTIYGIGIGLGACLISGAALAASVHVKFDNPIFNGSGYDVVGITYPGDSTNPGGSASVAAGRFQGTGSNVQGVAESIFVDGLGDLYMYCYDVYEHISSGRDVDYTINFAGPTARGYKWINKFSTLILSQTFI